MGRRKKTGVMTAEAFSVPFQAGGAIAATAGRLTLSAIGLFMRAPLRNTAVAGLVTLSAMAGSNALYKQDHHHPAPLFGNFETTAQSQGADPVMPAARPTQLEATPALAVVAEPETPVATSQAVSNEDVFEIQRKLRAFGMLDGKVDGLFGPKTIRAIKAFEVKIGQPPRGELTADIVALIKATPIFATPTTLASSEPATAEPATPEPAMTQLVDPAPEAPAATAPLALAETAAPGRLTAAVIEPTQEQPLPPPAPLLGSTGPAAPDADLAGTEITAAIETPAVTPGASPAAAGGVTKRTVQTVAVRAASAPAATQQMPAALDPPPSGNLATDPKAVAAVQRGLASLGFLHGEADGVAGEATAKAIRNFEIYFNYDVTGRVSPDLLKLLVQNGAVI
jgi:peptidoglycan hydrolase-like protein with peptidoglycan-binding domain